MAMRPRGVGGSAPNRGRVGGVRRVYEDFKPMSEWQQDDESHILVIYLPGFMKEQIKVSTEDRNVIRVRGERLVAGNKWNRFQEDYQVPDNGEIKSVRAKFTGGTLNITIPKREVDKPQEALPPKPQLADFQKPSAPQKGQEANVFQEIATSQPKEKASTQPQTISGDPRTKQSQDGGQKLPTPQIGQDKVIPQVGTSASQTDDKSLKHDKFPADDSKQVPEAETGKKMELLNKGAIGIPAMKTQDKESKGKQALDSRGAFTMGNYKKAVKGLTELNEERQLLVNMGVAVMVIMALSAYVTYTFTSGKDRK